MSTTPYAIPLTDVHIAPDDVVSYLAALEHGWASGGEATTAFETAFAAWVGSPHAVAVASGTSALHLALLAAGVGAGDEVLVPAFTFVASAAAVRYCGAEPVLCDVVSAREPLLDPADAAARVTARTRAILPVHFFGYPADMGAVANIAAEHGLAVVEDVAQGVGARLPDGRQAGTVGLGCFSLFSKKQLCVGEGGLVTTADAGTAERLRALRTGGTGPHAPVVPQEMGEPHAALALSRLARLAGDVAHRRACVERYRECLAGIDGLELCFDEAAVDAGSHFAFPVLLRDLAARDAVRAALRADGIQTTCYPAVSQLTAYAGTSPQPAAEEAADRHCVLPLSSSTTPLELDTVVAAVRAALAAA